MWQYTRCPERVFHDDLGLVVGGFANKELSYITVEIPKDVPGQPGLPFTLNNLVKAYAAPNQSDYNRCPEGQSADNNLVVGGFAPSRLNDVD